MRRARRKAPLLDVVFTGGGTAGHVEPALALAHGLVSSGHELGRIHFVGAKQGMEAHLVPDAGYSITLLPGRGIRRRLTVKNITALLGLFVALLRALVVLARRRPAVVVTLGGYAGLPTALSAVLLGIPLVVVNLDAVPGASNRLVSRFATRCALAFPGAGLPHAVLTGAPLRAAVLAVSGSADARLDARKLFEVPKGRTIVVIVGGSLGAGRLNVAALGLARLLSSRDDLLLFHVAGARNYERVRSELAGLGLTGSGLDYRLVAFEPQLPALLGIAALVISRAGAMTVAELAAIGAPSILVPLPNAPSDHQRKNAGELEVAGGAIVIGDDEATAEHLVSVIVPLLDSPQRLQEMADAARSVGRRDATARIIEIIEELAPGQGRSS